MLDPQDCLTAVLGDRCRVERLLDTGRMATAYAADACMSCVIRHGEG